MTRKTVLLVDDDPLMLEICDLALTQAGYTVAKASSGEAALQMARRIRAGVIILDIQLPDISGLKVLQALRRRMGLQMPVLIMSRASDAETIQAALKSGANGYLVKPVVAADLVRRVDAMGKLPARLTSGGGIV